MKMKFKEFEFPVNPSIIEVKTSTSANYTPVLEGGSVVENMSNNPTVITGSGVFYGDKGEEYCLYLQHLLRQKEAGALMLPSAVGLMAYLTKLNYKKDTNINQITYSFEFVEKSTNKKEQRQFYFTYARQGENAFDIANRCGVNVEDIMNNNLLLSPFSISEGDRVVLL